MTNSENKSKSKLEVTPSVRGFAPVYRPGHDNECPGCHGHQWWVGRFSAQCGYCHTAMPFQEGASISLGAGARAITSRPDMRSLKFKPLEAVA